MGHIGQVKTAIKIKNMRIEKLQPVKNFTPIQLNITIETEEEYQFFFGIANVATKSLTRLLNDDNIFNHEVNILHTLQHQIFEELKTL